MRDFSFTLNRFNFYSAFLGAAFLGAAAFFAAAFFAGAAVFAEADSVFSAVTFLGDAAFDDDAVFAFFLGLRTPYEPIEILPLRVFLSPFPMICV